MEKTVVSILLTASLLNGANLNECAKCHDKKAPPFNIIYRKYLVTYSSKKRIKEKMVDFLLNPSDKKSILPQEMKKRFFPRTHPAYSISVAEKTVEKIIEKEDPIKKIKIKH